jgi:hypothetical protein
MSDRNYSKTFTVEQSRQAVFEAINNVRGWWSAGIDGDTDRLGATFKLDHFEGLHRCELKITEFVPGRRVVWHVLSNSFSFIKDQSEWVGTDIVFDIAGEGDKTRLIFTHEGLVPDYECYEVCSDAWGSFISGSLRNLITTGKGQPIAAEAVMQRERELTN